MTVAKGGARAGGGDSRFRGSRRRRRGRGRSGTRTLRAGTRAWFASLLPAERDARAMEEAVAALARGERALGEKNAKAAIEALSKIETLVPREYKLNQRAGLLLSEAYKLAGDNARYLEYKNRVWWWGRGLRWPGWYIIAYLSARSAYFDAREDDEAAFTMSEAGVVAPLWVGLLFAARRIRLARLLADRLRIDSG